MTDEKKLDLATEFQIPYWITEYDEHSCLTVKRDFRRGRTHWAIQDGAHGWTGTHWDANIRGEDLYLWELDEALELAQQMALRKNAHLVKMMEAKFPGAFVGSRYDMNTRKKEADD